MALASLNNCQMGNFKLRVDYAKKKMGEGSRSTSPFDFSDLAGIRIEQSQTNTKDFQMNNYYG
jgi:hypothetical protein